MNANLNISGADVAKLRQKLGFEVVHFATLLGIHSSTVYRWEKQDKNAIRPEPLQLHLLVAIGFTIAHFDRPPEDGAAFRRNLLRNLLVGGTLAGMHCLLSWFFKHNLGPWEHQKQESRRGLSKMRPEAK